MLSAIRRRMTYANVAATLALVFAMSGGAYAASRYVITSTKQISPKVLKALKGNAGANGAQGSAGSVGASGPAGPAGPQGPAGQTGKEGPPGKNGENGKDGTTGFTETLPSGKTEKGDWSVVENVSKGLVFVANSVSFNIPLATAPVVHYITSQGNEPVDVGGTIEEVKSTSCLGTAAEPSAAPGNLCVYGKSENNSLTSVEAGGILPAICSLGTHTGLTQCTVPPGVRTADPYGFGIVAISKEEGLVQVWGTWAVTAE
jgi:Collagen triple helix repeat (20 copies)